MLNCNLKRVDGEKIEIGNENDYILSERSQNDGEALHRFGERLGVTLTFDGEGQSEYLYGSQKTIDDPLKSATWASATRPVFSK